MTAWFKFGAGVRCALLALVLATCLAMAVGPVRAADRAQLFLPAETGFARLIISFPNRVDLPAYRLRMENNVLAVEFDTPIDVTAMPDVAASLPDFVTIARVDPDGGGIRFGLRMALRVNPMEAGEQLFLDLLPNSWQGLPPGLPQEVVTALAERAAQAQQRAEEQARAEEAARLKPDMTIRVGRNPTFYRAEFAWSEDTEASFVQDGTTATLDFDWPVPIDLYPMLSTLPAEVIAASSEVGSGGVRITLELAEGVAPRFYRDGARAFTLDIDRADADPAARGIVMPPEPETAAVANLVAESGVGLTPAAALASDPAAPVVPLVSDIGGTVRVTFPFDADIPAAAFRRGDTVWLIFDTVTPIGAPAKSTTLDRIASGFTAIQSGDAQTVRIDLAADRLPTLGSEGRAWVLSLGDMPLNPTEPMSLTRRRDREGRFEMVADLLRPSRVHAFHDPDVGDTLQVVTVMPPARGLIRDLRHVDFDALASIHGFVVRPLRSDVVVDLQGRSALVRAPGGLQLSAMNARPFTLGEPSARRFYIDLNSQQLSDPGLFETQKSAVLARAAESEGRARDLARLELADLYLSNRLAEEAIGVLRVLEDELGSDELRGRLRLTTAAANVAAHRAPEALAVLDSAAFGEQADPLVWRTIARAEVLDWTGARSDAMAAESLIDAYPAWVRVQFLFAAARASIEAGDATLGERYLSLLPHGLLDDDQMSLFALLSGRVEELTGQPAAALELYGQVLAADRRPTRPEAVYRTLLLLDQDGRIDTEKAAATLSGEVLMWRGGPLEAEMLSLLADLYFRTGRFREGFETVRQAVTHHPDSKPVNALMARADAVFSSLYLDGAADSLPPIEALSLYYDFSQFTPPGARGDEMIRNLSRRLISVDLLAQAGDLLQYQIDSRVKGAAQAQVAAELAVIRLADRQPEAALRVLNATRLAELSPTLERQRRVLEARALMDAGRHDLALDMLSRLDGRDVQLLRADAHWAARRYGLAAEILEQLQSANAADAPMSQPARMSLVKAAVGFVLAGDTLGVSRLRSKFAAQMAQSAEWPLFDFVTAETVPLGPEFRQISREVAGLDMLDAFLTAYRQTYGPGSAPLKARQHPDEV